MLCLHHSQLYRIKMASNATLLFTLSLLLTLVFSNYYCSPCHAARLLLQDNAEPELHPLPEIPEFPKPELPPFPEFPAFPKPDLPPFPEIPTLTKQEHSNSAKEEEPKLPPFPEIPHDFPKPELPPLPEIPHDFPKLEFPPFPEIPHLLPEEPKHP